MKKALIIGISGQDGAYLARFLLSKGYKVFGTSRDHEVNSFFNLNALGITQSIELLSMVTSDFRSVLATLQAVDVDEMYNLAGQTSVGLSFLYPVQTFDSILTGTMNLLECIRLLKRPVKYYNAGSSEVFGNTSSPADENTAFRPRRPYATAKAAAHYAVANYREAYSLFASNGILFNHESPLRLTRFVTSKIVSTAVRIAHGSDERLRLGNINVFRDWGWAPDFVEGMWKILQNPEPDDFVLASGESHSLEEFASQTFALLGLNYQNHIDIDPTLIRLSDISYSAGNPVKAKHVLHWEAEYKFYQIVKMLVEYRSDFNITN